MEPLPGSADGAAALDADAYALDDGARDDALSRADARVTAARWVLQLGAVAVALLALTFREFELDRFFVPKELALHIVAVAAGVLLLRRIRDSGFTVVDALLALFLLLGIVSAVFAANPWLAIRATALSTSAVLVFWCAAAIARSGQHRPLLAFLAFAVIAGTATSLLQAYGVRHDIFSINRAPGGTLGNRNSIAHLAAFGLPLVMLGALAARRWYGYVAGALGTMLVMTALVLTRSRAAWLALIAVLAVLAVAFLLAPALRRNGVVLRRLAGLALLGGAGAAGAVLLPNSLQWRSDSPYLDSLRGVADYQDGSGAGRVVQYRRSLAMATSSPLLGVGPGNWPVVYPAHAAPRDPSLSGSTPGTTSNPWPSSDWVAFISERGFAATGLLALAFLVLLGGALRRITRAADTDDALAGLGIAGIIAGAVVTGLFDAVLLLALPAFIVFAALGALYGTGSPAGAEAPSPRVPGVRRALVGVLVLVSLVGAVRSSAQVFSMWTFTQTSNAAALNRAALVDPGNFRLRVRLARSGSGLSRAERCRHARAAHAQFPEAQEARRLSRQCG